ncbi:stearoyl-coa desaturase, putative, partial [Perkinsus marinus ATCC 50983]
VCVYVLSALGITAGAHRLWSHRSYRATYPLRVFLMICNSFANQGSIIHWASNHRAHHLHADTDRDPHDSQRGFFYAHIGWLLIHKPKLVADACSRISVEDLYNDNVLLLQH